MRATLIGLALLIALPAQATWRSTTTTGVPRDVSIVDAGVALVASNGTGGQVALVAGNVDAGISVTPAITGASNFVSAAWRPPNCVVGLTQAGLVAFSSPSCGTAHTLNTPSYRLRGGPDGALYVYASTPTNLLRVQRLERDAGSSSTEWASLGSSFNLRSTDGPLDVLALPQGAEFAAWGEEDAISGNRLLTVFLDAGPLTSFVTGGLRDISLFDLGGRPGALVVNDGGEVLINDDLVTGSFSPVPIGPLSSFSSIILSTAHGSAYGRGFGMLAAGSQLYSAVPNPNAVGRQWELRPAPAPFSRVSCIDARFCAAIVTDAGAPNVFSYFNEVAPQAQPLTVSVPAGGRIDLGLDAGDSDGDPIWVTWIDGGFEWDGGNPRFITVVGTPDVCSPAVLPPLVAVISDGYAAHDRTVAIPLTVTGASSVLPPIVSPSGPVTLTAGEDSGTVTASFPDAGCPATLGFSFNGTSAVAINIAGGTATLTPPAVWCSPDAGSFALTVTVNGVPDASVPVTLLPWGKPATPTFNAPLSQLCGTSQDYLPIDLEHTCKAITAAFPGAPLKLLSSDGGVTTDGGSLTVDAKCQCTGSQASASVGRVVTGTSPAQTSPTTGGFDVQLLPNIPPIGSASFDAGFAYDAGGSSLGGTFFTTLACATERGLQATVRIALSDGGQAEQTWTAPGPWSLDVPGGCAGGSFVAVATLIDDAGVGPAQVYPFVTTAIPANLPALATTEVPLTCEGGASATLVLGPSNCAAQTVSWAQTGGPALIDAPQSGSTVTFATAPRDLEGQAGQDVTWSVTATVGPGNSESGVRSVRLVPAPFVELSHRTDVPVAREEEAVGVQVRLTNTTSCAVSGLTLRESLGGLKPIAGSIRLGGARVEAQLTADSFEVTGLALPANGSITLTYAARVPLLSAARPSAQVALRGLDVTLTTRGLERPATGCGCQASHPGLAALLALALLVRSRRRLG